MTEPLFTDASERQVATVIAAAVALHALTLKCEHIRDDKELVKEAFDLSEAFIAEAEARCAPPAAGELMHVSA